MKPIKRFIAFTLAVLMLAGLPQVIFAAPKVGDVVDYVLHTDIVTYINGLPIRSYNIKGYTAVIVEDLSNYGFYVVWDGGKRTLSVTRLESVPIVGGYTPEKNTKPIGSKAMPVYFTDIGTYLDGQEVESYNVGGRTIIYVDDLAEFYAKEYVWDPKARTLSLTLKGASAPGSGSEEKPGFDEKPDSDSSGGPVIVNQPESCEVYEDEYAVFAVTASGSGLKYQWQRDERLFTSLLGMLTGGKSAGKPAGKTYGNTKIPELNRFRVYDEMRSPGNTAKETKGFEIFPIGDLISIWNTWNWVDLSDGDGISGAKTSKLTVLADLDAINSGSYRCVITDRNGNSVTSDYASIIPISPGITITSQPQDQTKKAGDYANLYVGAEGLDLKYQWQELVASYAGDGGAYLTFEYKNIEDDGKFSGTKTNTLTLKVDPPMVSGVILPGKRQEYICLVTDRYGLTLSSAPAKINSLLEIKITEQPKSVTQTVQAPVELHIKAEGDFPLYYRWQFLYLGSWADVPEGNAQFAGVDTPTLSWNRDSNGSCKFRCVVNGRNSEPVISDEVMVAFNLPPKDYQIQHPKTFRGKFNDDAYFEFGFTDLKVNSLDCRWQQKGRDGKWVDLDNTNSTRLELDINLSTSGCWYRCTGKVNGHKFTTMPAKLEGTITYRRQGLTETTMTVKTNGNLHWIDMREYVRGEGLTYEWQGYNNKVPENCYVIEPEYRVEKFGSEVHIIRTEVNGSKLGISTTGEYVVYTKHTGGSGWLQGRDEIYVGALTLYQHAYCIITDNYGHKITFHVTIEYIEL